jgi:predicted ATP-dependent serine protease
MAVEIIGRREELLAFDGFFEALPAGGQALLLEGDAGIGKSALWQEGNRLARESGFRVLTSRSAHSRHRSRSRPSVICSRRRSRTRCHS